MEKSETPEKGESKSEEVMAVEGKYVVDGARGYAKMPADVDPLGKIHIQKWVRQRLGILNGAEVKIELEVIRRY